MKRIIGGLTLVLALSSTGTAFANPSAPTSGGNGGGASGQCTGAASDRPGGCYTSK